MHRTQFTFYGWFLKKLHVLKDDYQRYLIYNAITCYALCGEKPDLRPFTWQARLCWYQICPTLWWERMLDLLLGRNVDHDQEDDV